MEVLPMGFSAPFTEGLSPVLTQSKDLPVGVTEMQGVERDHGTLVTNDAEPVRCWVSNLQLVC